jgi:hypothetical protein
VRAAILVCCLVLFAGCTAPTSPSPEPTGPEVTYTVSNDDDRPVRVVLAVAPPDTDTFRVEYRNDTSRTVRGSDLSEVSLHAPADAVAVVPVGPDVTERSYTLAPNSGVGGRFEAAPPGAALVTSLGYSDGEFRGATVASCGPGGNLTAVDIRVAPGGNNSVAVTCS